MDIRRWHERTKLEYDCTGLTVDWALIFIDPRAQLSLCVTPGLPQLHHMDAVGQVMSPGWYPPNPLKDKRFYLAFISPKTRFSHNLRDFQVSLTEEKLWPESSDGWKRTVVLLSSSSEIAPSGQTFSFGTSPSCASPLPCETHGGSSAMENLQCKWNGWVAFCRSLLPLIFGGRCVFSSF